MLNGMILIDKPAGWTSFDVVARIRGIVSKGAGKRVKVGHSGTLDPFATGLLLIFIGNYTKRVQYFTKLDKTYLVEMKLGEISSTGDPEGSLSLVSNKMPSKDQVLQSLDKFVGKYLQKPPAHSAIKIDGQRAYHLARQGKVVELEARPVTIHNNVLTQYDYPIVRFSSSVSSGTYIRSLVQDIGEELGVGAYTLGLRRSEVGNYQIKDAVDINKCTPEEITNRLIQLPDK